MPARACQLTVKGFLTQAIQATAPHLRPQESLQGTGKGSSCIHTAVCTKKPWPPPPLAFPEPLQGTCSFTLPQRALTHTLVLLPPAQRTTTALSVRWKKRDSGQRLKFRLLGHQLSSYPSKLSLSCAQEAYQALRSSCWQRRTSLMLGEAGVTSWLPSFCFCCMGRIGKEDERGI